MAAKGKKGKKGKAKSKAKKSKEPVKTGTRSFSGKQEKQETAPTPTEIDAALGAPTPDGGTTAGPLPEAGFVPGGTTAGPLPEADYVPEGGPHMDPDGRTTVVVPPGAVAELLTQEKDAEKGTGAAKTPGMTEESKPATPRDRSAALKVVDRILPPAQKLYGDIPAKNKRAKAWSKEVVDGLRRIQSLIG